MVKQITNEGPDETNSDSALQIRDLKEHIEELKRKLQRKDEQCERELGRWYKKAAELQKAANAREVLITKLRSRVYELTKSL